ncbi:MAG: methylated-DNA--[protein]-cysteine S-methyltransferase [Gemmatimonadales bacterium]
MTTKHAERAALERIVAGAFAELTGRKEDPVQYTMMTDTPVGVLGLASGEAGLCRLDFVKDEEHFLKRLLDAFDDRPVFRSDALDNVRRELDRYFAGKDLRFDVPVDLSAVHGFSRKVLEAAIRIRPGHVLSYTEIAAKAGNARASRAAGNALHDNPIAIVVPCHRIVRSDGSLGGYGGGLPAKEWLLQHEGATLV